MSVYFIRNKVTGDIKIGESAAPEERLRTLQLATDCELEIAATWHWGGREHEAFFHEGLAEHRVRGEWFRPDESVVSLMNLVRSAESDDDSETKVWELLGAFDPPPKIRGNRRVS